MANGYPGKISLPPLPASQYHPGSLSQPSSLNVYSQVNYPAQFTAPPPPPPPPPPSYVPPTHPTTATYMHLPPSFTMLYSHSVPNSTIQEYHHTSYASPPPGYSFPGASQSYNSTPLIPFPPPSLKSNSKHKELDLLLPHRSKVNRFRSSRDHYSRSPDTRNRSKERKRSKDRARKRSRERSHDRSRSRKRSRSRSRGRSCSRSRVRERSKDRDRERRRHSNERARSPKSIDQSEDMGSTLRNGKPGSSSPNSSKAEIACDKFWKNPSERLRERYATRHLKMTIDEVIAYEQKLKTKSTDNSKYYQKHDENPSMSKATDVLVTLMDRFETSVVTVMESAKEKLQGDYVPCKITRLTHSHGCCDRKSRLAEDSYSDDSSSESDVDDQDQDDGRNESLEWMEHRAKQAFRLSPDLWDNRSQELNDGPSCRCSLKARRHGIRHGVYPGEDGDPIKLDPLSNNADKLFHYRVTVTPPTNFLVEKPTVIMADTQEYVFEGFSLFSVRPLSKMPVCVVNRFNFQYSILFFEEDYPHNVSIRELELFQRYFFKSLLELVDWDLNSRFFFMPRFVRDVSELEKEILPMADVLAYLLDSFSPVVEEMQLLEMIKMAGKDWQDEIADPVKGMLLAHPGMAPAAIRADQLDRSQDFNDVLTFPLIVHFGSKPQQLCYAKNSNYLKIWREYIKFRHLLANMRKPSQKDKEKKQELESKLNKLRSANSMKRDVAITVSSQGFFKTGLMTDIVQHGLVLPSLVHHVRLHLALDGFEEKIGYKFKNRYLLQLAMTHPSYKENAGTNPDHIRNALSNCGIRQPRFGDRKEVVAASRKKGINRLFQIMSRFGKTKETESKLSHNERLEFLGDAVIEFITTVHLFYIFTDYQEGALATFRGAIVQNKNLAQLAKSIGLDHHMLFAHGSDLCYEAELRHAMANCFEALFGAIFLDGGVNESDRVLAKALYGQSKKEYEVWTQLEPHPLQQQCPEGDREWVKIYPVLEKLVQLEEKVGFQFKHIRLLARAFSDRSLNNCNLTMGSNQRLEFLGDTVLQLITSDYLYRHFPEHHEGHLSLLRSAIVNNKTQSIVCDDLDLSSYAMYANFKKDMKLKDKADLVEALIGALYVDQDLEVCTKFAEVCFFPRIQQFIVSQEWNDPKSKLQQCCLTLRTMNGKEPDIPIYKTIEAKGPTNSRQFTVAVYFRNERLAEAQANSIQQAEMAAAAVALEKRQDLFPHLTYQRKIVKKSLERQSYAEKRQIWLDHVQQARKKLGLDVINQQSQMRNAERAKKIVEIENKRPAKHSSESSSTSSSESSPRRARSSSSSSSSSPKISSPKGKSENAKANKKPLKTVPEVERPREEKEKEAKEEGEISTTDEES